MDSKHFEMFNLANLKITDWRSSDKTPFNYFCCSVGESIPWLRDTSWYFLEGISTIAMKTRGVTLLFLFSSFTLSVVFGVDPRASHWLLRHHQATHLDYRKFHFGKLILRKKLNKNCKTFVMFISVLFIGVEN